MPDQTYSVTIRATDSVGLFDEWSGSIFIKDAPIGPPRLLFGRFLGNTTVGVFEWPGGSVSLIADSSESTNLGHGAVTPDGSIYVFRYLDSSKGAYKFDGINLSLLPNFWPAGSPGIAADRPIEFTADGQYLWAGRRAYRVTGEAAAVIAGDDFWRFASFNAAGTRMAMINDYDGALYTGDVIGDFIGNWSVSSLDYTGIFVQWLPGEGDVFAVLANLNASNSMVRFYQDRPGQLPLPLTGWQNVAGVGLNAHFRFASLQGDFIAHASQGAHYVKLDDQFGVASVSQISSMGNTGVGTAVSYDGDRYILSSSAGTEVGQIIDREAFPPVPLYSGQGTIPNDPINGGAISNMFSYRTQE